MPSGPLIYVNKTAFNPHIDTFKVFLQTKLLQMAFVARCTRDSSRSVGEADHHCSVRGTSHVEWLRFKLRKSANELPTRGGERVTSAPEARRPFAEAVERRRERGLRRHGTLFVTLAGIRDAGTRLTRGIVFDSDNGRGWASMFTTRLLPRS